VHVQGFLLDGLGSGLAADGLPTIDPALDAALAIRDAGGGPGPRGDAWELPAGLSVAGSSNGWANGHFANHPPKGKAANVVGWPYDFPPQVRAFEAMTILGVPSSFFINSVAFPGR
jgi:hypothetical protein